LANQKRWHLVNDLGYHSEKLTANRLEKQRVRLRGLRLVRLMHSRMERR